MSLKIKIAARLKVKAAGVNLSKERIDAIVARAEKGGLTDESDDTAIDAQLDLINELSPFKEMAQFDDYQRAKAKKDADDKEALRLKAIEDGKPVEVELPADTPEWMKVFMKQQADTNKALQDQIASFGKEKVTNTRREQYAKTLEGTDDKFKAKALKDFDRISFKDDEDFNVFLTEAETDAKEFAKPEDPDNGIGSTWKPAGGTGPAGGKKEASAAEVDAAVDSII